MLVVVLAVRRVLVAVVHVVDVTVVLHGVVTARRTVLVVGDGVLGDALVLVVVTVVQSVVVRAVDVVGVVVVLDGLVAAVRSVLVLGDGVLGVDVSRAHDCLSKEEIGCRDGRRRVISTSHS